MFTPTLTNALHDFSIPTKVPEAIRKKSNKSVDNNEWKQLENLKTELFEVSKLFQKTIEVPNEKSIGTVVNCEQKIESIRTKIKILETKSPSINTEEFVNLSEQLLQQISYSKHLLGFEQEYATLKDELYDALEKMSNQEWLLSRGDSSFSAANYMEIISILQKFYELHNKHDVFPDSCENAHEYLYGHLKEVFGLVDSAIRGHSTSVKELFPRVLAERQQEVLLAQQNLAQTPNLANYTKLVESTKRLELLHDQFQKSNKNLEKTQDWISEFRSDLQPKSQDGFAQSAWNSIMGLLFNPSTKEGRLGLIADQFQQDQIFYSDAERQLKATIKQTNKIIKDGTKQFLKSLNKTPLKSGGHGIALLETVMDLKNSTLNKAPTISEFVAIRRQIDSISFLLEQCKTLKTKGDSNLKETIRNIEQAHKEGEKLLRKLEKQNPDLQYSEVYEEVERYALLEAQWEEEISASEMSEETKRKISLLFLGIQLAAPTFKAIGSLVDIIPEATKALFSAQPLPSSTSSLEGWTQGFLEGTNTTAADFAQYTPSQVLKSLKQIEYEKLRLHDPVPDEYTERSYLLREECLSRSEGGITSCEAFTYSNDPNLCKSTDKLISEQEWHPNRLIFQRKVIDIKFKEAMAMSRRFNDTGPTVYAMRGNTASGKTRTIKGDPFFKKAFDMDGQMTGAINPDIIKSKIREETAGIGHQQTHRESSVISTRLVEKIAHEATTASVLIDKRLNEIGDVEDVIFQASNRGAKVNFFDVDTPLEDSCLGVLTRPADGEDPLVPFEAVAQGYSGIRQNRIHLIDKIQNDPNVGFYKLFSKGILIAYKEVTGRLNVVSNQAGEFERVTSAAQIQNEIVNVGNKILSSEYIKSLLQQRPFLAGIEKFEGMTIKAALNFHAGEKT